ncbi:MAG TPA: phage portal protein, partial [Gemmatimonadaceae bacterium]|nr:phage portal protein [Gemmatimonadaceae bacterium]
MPTVFDRALARTRGPAGSGGGSLVPSYLSKLPQWTSWGTKRAVDEGFKASVWVYISIQRLMKAAASVPWYAYEKRGSKWEKQEDHPLSQLMARPNPFMSRQTVIEFQVAHLHLAGNAMLKKIEIRGQTRELWPIWELDKIQPVPSSIDFLDRYDFRRDGDAIPIYPSEVVHSQFIDPSNPFWGMSPLQAAARIVDTDIEAVRWNKITLQNRAVPDGVFVIPQQQTRAQLDEARAIVTEKYSGADNARVPWVIGSGMTYTQMSLTPVEMDWLESRKMTREEICATFGVPPAMVGIMESSSLGNDYLDSIRRIFWSDTVIPILDLLMDSFNRSVTPAFGDPAVLQLRYDTTGVEALREDLGDKITQFGKLMMSGVPVNMAAQRLNLGIDKIDGGDVALVPGTLVPIADAGQG